MCSRGYERKNDSGLILDSAGGKQTQENGYKLSFTNYNAYVRWLEIHFSSTLTKEDWTEVIWVREPPRGISDSQWWEETYLPNLEKFPHVVPGTSRSQPLSKKKQRCETLRKLSYDVYITGLKCLEQGVSNLHRVEWKPVFLRDTHCPVSESSVTDSCHDSSIRIIT